MLHKISFPVLNPAPVFRPLLKGAVRAGFPSAAEDYIEEPLDLHKHLIRHVESTFYFEVRGHSMMAERIFDRDVLVVDRSINPRHGQIVVATINGEHTVKRLYRKGSVTKLCAGNPEFPDIVIPPDGQLFIWGVVTGVVRKL